MSKIDVLWFTRCPSPTAASIAVHLGWLHDEFAADGIEVRSLAASNDKNVQLSHYRHTQPNSFRFGGYVPPLVAASRGADLKIIGLGWPDRSAAVLAFADSGIATAIDLKGRRLAVPRRINDSIDWWRAMVLDGYRQALAKAGLGWNDVYLVDIEIEEEYVADAVHSGRSTQSLWGAKSQFAVQRQEIIALIKGQVDVIFSDAAMGALVRAFLGLVAVVDVTSTEDQPFAGAGHPTVLTVSGTLLAERPDLVARWLSRLLKARTWAPEHVADARRILAMDTGVPEDLVEIAYSGRVYAQLDISLAHNRLALLQAKHDHLLEDGFLAAPIALEELADPRPLAMAERLLAAAQGGVAVAATG